MVTEGGWLAALVGPDEPDGERSPRPDPDVRHRDGVPWNEAPIPRRLHRCSVQTSGWTGPAGLTQILRCACGAIADGIDVKAARAVRPSWLAEQRCWKERNQRRRRPVRRKRFALLALAVLPLGACSWFDDDSDGGSTRGEQLYVETVEVNGREVACVVYDSNSDHGALDCDFEADR
jgi:hypothetical protein